MEKYTLLSLLYFNTHILVLCENKHFGTAFGQLTSVCLVSLTVGDTGILQSQDGMQLFFK